MEFKHWFFSTQASSFLMSAYRTFSIRKVLLFWKFIYLFALNLKIYFGMLLKLQCN